MVSYYNPPMMYRHHQPAVPTPGAQFPNSPAMHSWYTGYHQGAGQMGAAAASASYCMQDEQQVWHTHHSHPHSVFAEFSDFASHVPAIGMQQQHGPDNQDNNLHSPPISGSDMSSPGVGSGNPSPPNQTQVVSRPPPARSPYEWIKKTSYTIQPNPGKTRTKDKYRVVYTDHQRVELEKEFYYSRYITIRRKAELANNLGLSERQVKIWFQNRRAKERKQVKKREEFSHKDNTSSINNMAHMTQPHMIHSDAQLGQGIMTAPTLI